MSMHEFIFSKKYPERFLRHLAFWTVHFIFWGLWAGVFFRSMGNWVSWLIYEQGFFSLHIYYHIFYTYLIVYYLWPKYFQTKRYWKLTFSVAVLSLFTYLMYVIHIFWLKDLTSLTKGDQILRVYYSLMHFLYSGPPVVCAIFLTVKMLKNYYLKMQEKATLIEESANAEMQLLKAQIHPHFLFNTLNNIYSFNLDKSPIAADLVLKLSHTLKYMINDCDAALVPLEKEVNMLQDYIGLETVRYGSRLKMTAVITGDSSKKLIAPLLLIPFVENSFKHGASKMLEYPWIEMKINILDTILDFELSNSKPEHAADLNGKNGIGLSNVKKRLELLYSNNYSLILNDTPTFFHVNLRLPLEEEKIAAPKPDQEPEITEPAL